MFLLITASQFLNLDSVCNCIQIFFTSSFQKLRAAYTKLSINFTIQKPQDRICILLPFLTLPLILLILLLPSFFLHFILCLLMWFYFATLLVLIHFIVLCVSNYACKPPLYMFILSKSIRSCSDAGKPAKHLV